MRIIKCLGTAAVVLLICIIMSGSGYSAPERLHTIEVPQLEPYEYKYYDVPLADEQQRAIQRAAEDGNVPYEIVLGVMYAESSFQPDCIGDSGASVGIMQVQPYWHSWRMAEVGAEDWMNPVDNALVGIHIMSEKINNYGSLEKALVVYNMGDAGARGIDSTAYSRKVIEYAEALNER